MAVEIMNTESTNNLHVVTHDVHHISNVENNNVVSDKNYAMRFFFCWDINYLFIVFLCMSTESIDKSKDNVNSHTNANMNGIS